MGTQKVLIFGSAPYGDWGFLREFRDWPELVIAADGGTSCARAAGFSPNVYIGDSDSGGKAGPGMECVRLNPVKDLTDLQAAYEWARDRGAEEILLTGCTGGRQDHQLAAFQLLETARREGVAARLLDPWNEIRFLTPGSCQISRGGYRYFSLIPVDALLGGVTISGARYNLSERDVRRGDSLTVSNEWAEETVTIRFRQGCCFLIRSRNLN